MVDAHRDEIAKLESLYAEHPEGRIFTHLAEAYRKAGELDRAHEVLVEGIRRHPDYSSAHVVLGRVLADQGRSTEAESEFRRVLDLDGQNLVALRALGDMARSDDRRSDALDYYGRLLDVEPSNEEVREIVDGLAATHEPVGGPEVEAEPFGEPSAAPVAGPAEVDEPVAEAEPFEPMDWSGQEADLVTNDSWAVTEDEEAGSEVTGLETTDVSPAADDDWAIAAQPDSGDWRTTAPEPDEAEPPAVEPGVTTETIARVYARQGLYDRAADVYRELLRDRPDDEDLRSRLDEMEALAAGQAAVGTDEVALDDGGDALESLDAPDGLGGGTYATGDEPAQPADAEVSLETFGSFETSPAEVAEEDTSGAEPAHEPMAEEEGAGEDAEAAASIEGFESGELDASGVEVEPLPGLEPEADELEPPADASTLDVEPSESGWADESGEEAVDESGLAAAADVEVGPSALEPSETEGVDTDVVFEAPESDGPAEDEPAVYEPWAEASVSDPDAESSSVDEAGESVDADPYEPWAATPVSPPPGESSDDGTEAPAESGWAPGPEPDAGSDWSEPVDGAGDEDGAAEAEPWMQAPVSGEQAEDHPLPEPTDEPWAAEAPPEPEAPATDPWAAEPEQVEEPAADPWSTETESEEADLDPGGEAPDEASVWTGAEWTAPEPEPETPYAWAGEDEGAAEADETPPISDYFRNLLSWGGGSSEGTASAGPVADAGAGPTSTSEAEDAGGVGTNEPPSHGGDDDLEMFRAWLESLKQ